MTDNLEELERLLAKATPGDWDVDSEYDNDALYSGGGGCGSGFKNFFIGADVGGSWKTLLDTQNSDYKLIEEDYDEGSKNAWDEIGRNNAALIVALKNAAPSLIATAREVEGLRAAHEELGEALFYLSDKLRGSGFLSDDANHAAYEEVVAAFAALEGKGG